MAHALPSQNMEAFMDSLFTVYDIPPMELRRSLCKGGLILLSFLIHPLLGNLMVQFLHTKRDHEFFIRINNKIMTKLHKLISTAMQLIIHLCEIVPNIGLSC